MAHTNEEQVIISDLLSMGSPYFVDLDGVATSLPTIQQLTAAYHKAARYFFLRAKRLNAELAQSVVNDESCDNMTIKAREAAHLSLKGLALSIIAKDYRYRREVRSLYQNDLKRVILLRGEGRCTDELILNDIYHLNPAPPDRETIFDFEKHVYCHLPRDTTMRFIRPIATAEAA